MLGPVEKSTEETKCFVSLITRRNGGEEDGQEGSREKNPGLHHFRGSSRVRLSEALYLVYQLPIKQFENIIDGTKGAGVKSRIPFIPYPL